MPPQCPQAVAVGDEEPTQNRRMRRIVSRACMSEQEDDDFSPSNRAAGAADYRVRRSHLIGMINWTHVVMTHMPQMMILGLVLLLGLFVHQIVTENLGFKPQEVNLLSREILTTIATEFKVLFVSLYNNIVVFADHRGALALLSPAVKVTAMCLMGAAWWMQRQSPVYLMSFATFKPPESWKLSHEQIMECMQKQDCFSDEGLDFLDKILARSGTGQATAWPPGIVQCLRDDVTKADRSLKASRKEAETIIFDVVQQALDKAGVKPREIDVLIINCSLFSPTPSLCSMVLNHFDMRSDVLTYNLSGMGCSASLISVDLAKQLLGTRSKATKALVVSTEILTPNFYHGNDRGFLIQNTLFRCGGAAIVLSNSWFDGRHAWYKLLHTVRVQGNGDAAYEAVYETEDENGERGVRLSKDIVKVAGKCMEKNFTVLGPYVLPLTEQALVVGSLAARFFLKLLFNFLKNTMKNETLAMKLPTVKPYVPDFKTGIDHFCIHAGGRAVIDGIEKNMKLEPFHTEASRMTLYNYGNTSSSSIWYELEYIQESQKSNPLKKGDRILQVAFGSGFKCTSGVWLKL